MDSRRNRAHKGDTIVILDDDDSIHDAWDARFEEYADIIHLEHFEVGEEVINFINNASEKTKCFYCQILN